MFIQNKQFMMVTHKNETPVNTYLESIKNAIISGITCIQLREKFRSFDEIKSFAQSLQSLLKDYSIPLIINDSIEIANIIAADGVHLGQSDGCPKHARAVLGEEKIIGLSVNTLEEIDIANTQPIDYIGVGSVFKSQNKMDAQTIWEIHGLKRAIKHSKHPIIAIGGIDLFNLHSIIQTNVHGIAG
jgi:thiamine-phosphate pyrophosphorylase